MNKVVKPARNKTRIQLMCHIFRWLLATQMQLGHNQFTFTAVPHHVQM